MYTGISEKKLVTLLGGLWVLVIDCRNWCYVILFHDIEGSRVVTILLAEYDCHAEFRNGQREFPDFQDSKVAVWGGQNFLETYTCCSCFFKRLGHSIPVFFSFSRPFVHGKPTLPQGKSDPKKSNDQKHAFSVYFFCFCWKPENLRWETEKDWNAFSPSLVVTITAIMTCSLSMRFWLITLNHNTVHIFALISPFT